MIATGAYVVLAADPGPEYKIYRVAPKEGLVFV